MYGVTTGVGALRGYRVPDDQREQYSMSLLRSHACGAGMPLPAHVVRAAMATRANQIGAGGAGVARELLDALIGALNAGLSPFTRELGSLGTGDLTNLADIALALVGEGQVWRGDDLLDAGAAIADAGIAPARLGPRDGLAFMSSNAVSVARAALLVVDSRRLLDAWLSVAALSFEAGAADPVALDPRIHSARHRPGQAAVAARMRELLAGRHRAPAPGDPAGDPGPVPVPRPAAGRRHRPRRAAGARGDRLSRAELRRRERPDRRRRRRRAAQRQPARGAARQRDRQPAHRARPVRDADRRPGLDAAGLRADRPAAVSGASGPGRLRVRARSCSNTPRTPRPPRSARWSRRSPPRRSACHARVESHSSLAPIAARRAQEAIAALRVAVATELVVAVRALRLAGQEPLGAGNQALWTAATELLDPELGDRPLGPDVERARDVDRRLAVRARVTSP